MTDSAGIPEILERARTAIRQATLAIDHDQEFDLREVENEVDLAAAAATGVDARGDRNIQVALMNMVADLNALHARIRTERERAAERLGRSAVSRRAVVAYGQRMTP